MTSTAIIVSSRRVVMMSTSPACPAPG
jgi:hypothetical protein